jgi:hypothetical protein
MKKLIHFCFFLLTPFAGNDWSRFETALPLLFAAPRELADCFDFSLDFTAGTGICSSLIKYV